MAKYQRDPEAESPALRGIGVHSGFGIAACSLGSGRYIPDFMNHGRVLVIGSSNVDFTIYCERLPGAGETVLGGTFSSAIGGKGANQATAARRLGARTAFLSAVGPDDPGKNIRAHFVHEDVETHWAAVPDGISTGVAVILVDQRGQNSIAVAPGANHAMTLQDVEAVPFGPFSHVLISLEIPLAVAVAAAVRAKSAGCCVLLNPAPAALLPDELLGNCDILLPNEHEVQVLLPSGGAPAAHEEVADRFFAKGGSALIVTLGSEGAKIVQPDGAAVIPGFPAKVLDTVGAGDCFCGALAAALASGAELAGAVRFANRAASLSVQKRGAIPSIPCLADVERIGSV